MKKRRENKINQEENYNINEVSVRVDFDSSDSSSEDNYFGGFVSK